MDVKSFMKMPVTEKIFTIIFEAKTKSKDFVEILKYYNISKQDLYNLLWEEFNIPRMEVRIANTAFDYLIIDCIKKEEPGSLKSEIKECILAAAVFYTNVAPEACTTSDFGLPANNI